MTKSTDDADPMTALAAHPFARALARPQIEKLFGCGSVLTVPAGAFVFREGDPAGQLFLVRSGQVVLEQHVPGRDVVQMESLRGGDVLGFSWLFEGERWTLDARAVDTTEMFALDGACVRRRMQEDPALGMAIATQLIQHLYNRLGRVRMQRLDVYRAGP